MFSMYKITFVTQRNPILQTNKENVLLSHVTVKLSLITENSSHCLHKSPLLITATYHLKLALSLLTIVAHC